MVSPYEFITMFYFWICLTVIYLPINFLMTSCDAIGRGLLIDYHFSATNCSALPEDQFSLQNFVSVVKSETVTSPLHCLTRPSGDSSDPAYEALVVHTHPLKPTSYECHMLKLTASSSGLYALEPQLKHSTLTPFCKFYAVEGLFDGRCDFIGGTRTDARLVVSSLWYGHYTVLMCHPNTPTGDWTIIQRREDGRVNFTRSWHDYKYGFGSYHGEFWFGLENIRRLITKSEEPFEIRIDVSMVSGFYRKAVYQNFRIADETNRYRLSIDTGSYSGDAGDYFRDHAGEVFDTFDYQPRSSNACPEKSRGGFWYLSTAACHEVNPNGLFGSSEYKKGINWGMYTSFYDSALFMEIKIRQVY